MQGNNLGSLGPGLGLKIVNKSLKESTARIFVDCTLFGRETSMNGQQCGLKGPREVERVCLDFFSVLWRE